MLAAIAQFETELRAERQMDGIIKAKERGVKFGKKKKLNQQQIVEFQRKRKQGVLIKTLMREYGINVLSSRNRSRTTLLLKLGEYCLLHPVFLVPVRPPILQFL